MALRLRNGFTRLKNMNAQLNNIDEMSSGADWIKLVPKNSREIALRIRATSSLILESIVQENDICETSEYRDLQCEYAQKELIFRSIHGSDAASTDYSGYDVFNRCIHESLSADDPVSDWIYDFVSSDNSKFKGKSKKDRIRMALGAYYGAQRKKNSLNESRLTRITHLATNEDDEIILRHFIESVLCGTIKCDLLRANPSEVREIFSDFKKNLLESDITVGERCKIQCNDDWFTFTEGVTYEGIWRQSNDPNFLELEIVSLLKEAKAPNVKFNKLTKQTTIQKQFLLL
jgi:hypothetical protein